MIPHTAVGSTLPYSQRSECVGSRRRARLCRRGLALEPLLVIWSVHEAHARLVVKGPSVVGLFLSPCLQPLECGRFPVLEPRRLRRLDVDPRDLSGGLDDLSRSVGQEVHLEGNEALELILPTWPKHLADVRFQSARAEADALLKDLKWPSLPVDPFAIARGRGITIAPKRASPGGVSGFLLKVGEAFTIGYATHVQNEGFVRFTVAHELGHFFLPGHDEHLFRDGETTHSSHSGFVSSDLHELEADHFGAALLMPQALFRAAVRNAGIGFAAIEKLAGACLASITATAIRYARLTDDPVAVVVSSNQTIDYLFLYAALADLPTLRYARRSGGLVPPGTATARFNVDPTKVELGRRREHSTTLDLWFDGAPEIELDEDVIGLGSYGKTLTVLFTDEAIAKEDEL